MLNFFRLCPVVFLTSSLLFSLTPAAAQQRLLRVNKWITWQDVAAMKAGVKDNTNLALNLEVSKIGDVSKCTATVIPRNERLKKGACGLVVARARYKPAEDGSGLAINSSDSASFVFAGPNVLVTRDFGAARFIDGSIYDEDYPREAVSLRQQGWVVMALRINAEGAISDCQISISSGSAALDSGSCRLVKSRFRFIPAIGSKGVPLQTVGQFRIVWRLP